MAKTKPDIISHDTPINIVIKQFEGLSACSKAMTWVKTYKGKTYGELIANSKGSEYNQSWAVWALRKFGEQSSPEVRRDGILIIKDPMMAFSLYTDLTWLTDEESKLLENVFKGKLPTAETELTQGIVKREKS